MVELLSLILVLLVSLWRGRSWRTGVVMVTLSSLEVGGCCDPTGLPGGIPNTSAGTLPGDGVLIHWRKLTLQLPRTNNAGAPSYTDGRWWWRVEIRCIRNSGSDAVRSLPTTVNRCPDLSAAGDDDDPFRVLP